MKKILVLDQTFWNNDGSTAALVLTGFSAADVWFTPTTGVSGSVHTTGLSTEWFGIPLRGNVDELVVRYRSKITAIGLLGAVSTATVSPIVVGDMYLDSDSDFATPHEVSKAPQAVLNASGGTLTGNMLACTFWEGSTAQPPATGGDAAGANAGLASGGIFAESTPLVNDLWGWTFHIGKRQSITSAGGAVSQGVPSVSGIQNVWMQIQTRQTMAGTLATQKLKASIRVLGYKNVEEYADTNLASYGKPLVG